MYQKFQSSGIIYFSIIGFSYANYLLFAQGSWKSGSSCTASNITLKSIPF